MGAKSVLMEKRSPKPSVLLPTAGRLPPPPAPHMLKEINDAVSKGYAVAAGSGGDELIIIMEKATNAPDISSWLTSRSPSLEKEINAAGWGASSSPLPRALLAITRQTSMFGFAPDETSITREKEKDPQPAAVTYRIIGTTRVGTFKKELAQAAGEG
ncbi:MAG: hypothetical protein DMG70_03015 [Acidobacteria bacterium]|nr:MAG: hypothetical protein DMG70_03015 [Acidobacteriota bacterium]